MKIDSFTGSNLPNLREAIRNALVQLEEDFGVKFQLGACRYTSQACTFKLTVGTTKEDGTVFTPEAEKFKSCAHKFGLSGSDLFQEFIYKGDRYRIVGVSQKVRRFPILANAVSGGGKFKFPAYIVKDCLEQTRRAQEESAADSSLS